MKYPSAHFTAFGVKWNFACPSSAEVGRAKRTLGYYQPLWKGELFDPLSPKDIVVDVGAHIGFSSIPISTMVKKIVAYEPAPLNHTLLVKNVALNNCHNIKVIQAAVDWAPGSVALHIGHGSMGHSIVFAHGRKTTQVVAAESILEVAGKHTPTILKLDCEGAEWRILTKKSILHLASVRVLIVELHKVRAYANELEQIKSNLALFGFQFQITGNNNTNFQKLVAWRKNV